MAAGGALVHTLMIEKIPYSLRKYQLAPPLLLAGATAFLYTRYSINKCREEFFYLERKRAGAELPNASNGNDIIKNLGYWSPDPKDYVNIKNLGYWSPDPKGYVNINFT